MAKQDDRRIAFCSIFPKIGVARVGDSSEYFIGPESLDIDVVPDGGYKDSGGRVKQQASRFRLYSFDEKGDVIAELTSENTGSIKWRASVANKKASWHAFKGGHKALSLFEGTLPLDEVPPLRNADWPSDRRALVIKSTTSVGGRSQISAPLEGPIYDLEEPIYLGHLRTDDLGRLLFLGGHGRSRPVSWDDEHLLNQYANNDGWCDDTCDGVIEAEVTLADGTNVPVRGRAWVLVAPPDFAPHTDNLVTLFDVMEETALIHEMPWHLSSEAPRSHRKGVSFLDDVYPLLTRILGYQWVNERASRGHGPGKPGDFLGDNQIGALANPNDPQGKLLRQTIFGMLRNPNLSENDAVTQANLKFMPQLSGDEGDHTMGEPDTWLSVTKRQYETFKLWSEGKFDGFPGLQEVRAAISDKLYARKPLEQLPLAEQPFALTKAAMARCVGGPFFPGIEMTSISRSPGLYQSAFEIAETLEPGDITKWMALPWQADFYECNTHWWPAQRPDSVVTEFDYREAVKDFPIEKGEDQVAQLLFPRKQWDRGVGSERTFRPVYAFPGTHGYASPEAYAADCRSSYAAFVTEQWTNRGRSWQLPAPEDGETVRRYKFRLREYLDRYGSSRGWPFVLPRSTEGETASGYRKRLIGALTEFFGAIVPSPATGETLNAFARRLADEQATWTSLLAGSIQLGYEVRQNYQGDNDMVHLWKTLGFVARIPDISEDIFVETGRGKYDGLSDRDYFYMMLNIEAFPDFEPKARELVEKFLRAARKLQTTPQFKADPNNNVYDAFDYSPTSFAERLSEIYEGLAASATNQAEDWTPKALVLRILQFAPFNQLDGAWLRNATDAGPINEINSLLFNIWSDETGNGDPALNHANLYTSLMNSVGIYLPPLRSRAYADNPDILESAYTNPLFEMAISHFSRDYFPEILGMTLQLEWEVLGLWAGVKRLEAKGFDAHFYRMHIGIDNASEGHGAQAKRAIELYLDFVTAESGPVEAARQWKRIWNGYVAFETTGDISDDFASLRDYPPLIEDQMVSLIQGKKYYAQRNHSNLPIFGQNRMSDWFEEPNAFLDQLANSKYVTVGDPDSSTILNDRTTYRGPMYKIFTASELKLWADWIRWLGREYEPGSTPSSADPASDMKQLVETLAPTAVNVPAHKTAMVGGKSVADWFAAGPLAIMGALRDPANGWIVPGSSTTSKFITSLLPAAPAMDDTIRGVTIGSKDGIEIVSAWIDAGCPLPGEPAEKLSFDFAEVEHLTPDLKPEVVNILSRPRKPPLHRVQIFGQDAVH